MALLPLVARPTVMPTELVPPPAAHSAPPLPAVKPAEPPPQDSDAEETSPTNRWRRLPPWLISLILHNVALLILALVPYLKSDGGGRSIVLTATPGQEPVEVELQTMPSPEVNLDPEASVVQSERAEPVVMTRPVLGNTAPWRPTEQSPHPDWSDESAGDDSISILPKTGLDGRRPENRRRMALSMGGSEQSEAAVEQALKWFAAHQMSNGAWSFNLELPPCNGRCRNSRQVHNANGQRVAAPQTAAVGLALLPFLGAGHTHQEGEYSEVVSRGIYFLMDKMIISEQGGDLRDGNMYGHGIASLALTECYAMTNDPTLRKVAQEAVKFISTAQHKAGGWRYEPGQPGDMTVTGWQVMALKSGDLGGLHIPTPVWGRAREFVNSLGSNNDARFGYMTPGASRSPTAIGLLMEMYLHGIEDPEAFDDGLDWLGRLGPSESDLYFDYYGTLALFHSQHPRWHQWNYQIREYLIRTQADNGHEAGSWHFSDHHGDVGGRLYSTAMATLILETYYRYLPLYGLVPEEDVFQIE